MENAPYSHIDKGTFLIATPDIEGGLFFRAVILICEHSPNGSFGLLINKPIELKLPDDLININELANPNVGIRAGGPVQTSQMMLLHTSEAISQETLQVCTGVYLGGDLHFLQESVSSASGPQMLLCFGYSGWGAGQLEREFLDGHWFLQPASERLIFQVPPEKLWQTLLREMGGKYASLSMIPEDLTLN